MLILILRISLTGIVINTSTKYLAQNRKIGDYNFIQVN